MRKDELLSIMSERTGLEATKIAEIVNSESEEIEGVEIPTLHVFDENQLGERLKNHVELSKPTLIEMAIKEARKNNGLEFEGKTIDNLVNAAIEKGKKEAGLKPNEALQEKETMIENLRKSIQQIEQEKENELNRIKGELSIVQTNQYLNSIIPDGLDTPLSKSDLSILFKNDIQIVEKDGKKQFVKNGDIMRDAKTQNPLDAQTVINNWLSEKNITVKTEQKGRGGKNETGNTSTSLDSIETTQDFYNYCKENNISRKDQSNLIVEIRKNNPNFFLG